MKERLERVSCTFSDTTAATAPPRPLDAAHEMKEASERVKSHWSEVNSKTAPLPDERVMEEKFVSVKESVGCGVEEVVVREMRGEEEVRVKRVKLH